MADLGKSFIGVEKGIRVYHGVDVVGLTGTVKNADGTPFPFTGLSDVYVNIWKNARKEDLLVKLPKDGSPSGIVNTGGGVLTIGWDWSAAMKLPVDRYFWEVIWENATSQPDVVWYGPFVVGTES